MVMADSAAFNGDYKKNPFNFKTFSTSFLGITVNGEVPFRPLQLSYTAANPRYIEAFLTMFSGAGKLFYNAGNDVTRDEYAGGYAVYVADLTPDMCGSSPHFNVVQRGNLAVDIKFSTAPTDAVSLVCYGEFENTIHIDSERNVIYNFNPTGSKEFFHVLSNINMLKDLVRNEKRLNEHRTNHSCTKGRSYNEQEVLWNIS